MWPKFESGHGETSFRARSQPSADAPNGDTGRNARNREYITIAQICNTCIFDICKFSSIQ